MKTPKAKYNEWAHEYALEHVESIRARHNLTLIETAAMKQVIEQAMLCGMEIIQTLHSEGYDTSEATNLETYLKAGTFGAEAPPSPESNVQDHQQGERK